jgi:hypothetical protein
MAEELDIRATDYEEASAIAAALETMARVVVGQRIKGKLDYTPIEEKDAAELAELAARLTWTAEKAAEWNAIALAARKQEEN